MPRTPAILVSNIAPGDYVRGYAHACECCGTLFIGSSDARFCTNACRMKHKRAEKEAST